MDWKKEKYEKIINSKLIKRNFNNGVSETVEFQLKIIFIEADIFCL